MKHLFFKKAAAAIMSISFLFFVGCSIPNGISETAGFFSEFETEKDKEESISTEEQSKLSIIASDIMDLSEKEKITVSLNISRKTLFQGEILFIYIMDIKEGMTVTVGIEGFKYKSSWEYDKDSELIAIPVEYNRNPGTYIVNMKTVSADGILYEGSAEFNVIERDFVKHYMYVTETLKKVRSSENIVNDAQYVLKARSESHKDRLWEDEFIMPVTAPITTGFGVKRYLNDKFNNIHTGLDVDGGLGDEIKAPNNGIVKLSMQLRVTGYTIIIDHGKNIYTGYSHLSKLIAKEGQEVKKGEVIGLVGSTGFSTGPHLHWTATVGTTYIDPLFLIEENNMKWIEIISSDEF